jgi:PEP-CTERM motif
MKLRIASLSLLTLCCVTVAVTPAMAGSYSSGPPSGRFTDPFINDGGVVTDSYTLLPATPSTGMTFVYWDLSKFDLLATVDVSFGTAAFGGGTVTVPATNTFLFVNVFGYNMYEATINAGSGGITTGWVTLQNACTTIGGCIFDGITIGWDQCDNTLVTCTGEAFTLADGGSQSTPNEGATTQIPPESFTLSGGSGTTPEPSSILLFGSGILGVAGILRRRLF